MGRAVWTAAALAVTVAASGGARAAEPDAARVPFAATTLAISAEGEVRVTPDLAVLTAGVLARAPTASQALADDRARMTAALSALKAAGVDATDVQTSALDLQPQYADSSDAAARRLTGYQADNVVTVRLHDVARAGRVVDALVGAGVDHVDAVSFQLADPRPVEDAARRRAVAALQAKAELYAQAAGYRLQRLVQLSESVDEPPRFAPRVMMRAEAATPVSPGELTLRASVSAVYELTR